MMSSPNLDVMLCPLIEESEPLLDEQDLILLTPASENLVPDHEYYTIAEGISPKSKFDLRFLIMDSKLSLPRIGKTAVGSDTPTNKPKACWFRKAWKKSKVALKGTSPSLVKSQG
ncbi:hypothetical protein BASA61_000573 [Batrachochytrium salamandrivorans]|nr:hypothetical protein BASA62_008699 [Batrachochytrium salamandrivorans]KAH6582823.1 hypothetical protein BASA60_001719 [Batrachochytrium salamandrivorans]KAH6602947.1 hypothetical protein BASA61_000573 [Batrachochytrium salamandrivorans]KAH9266009.1 hypothetical protein BASA84_001353 [Batrachochytrium salamandrivorans]